MKYKITLSKFLSRYTGLIGINLTKLTHDDIKVLMPNIKRTSFLEIKNNPELIYKGNIILVNDGHKTIPYYVPETTDSMENKIEFDRTEIQERVVDDEIHDYSSMSIYELKCMLERKFNSLRNQKNARRELENRGIELKKKYDRNKEKQKIIEEE